MTFDEIFQQYVAQGFTKPTASVQGIESLMPTTAIPISSVATIEQPQETDAGGNDRDTFSNIIDTSTDLETPSFSKNIQTGGIADLIKLGLRFAIPGAGFLLSGGGQQILGGIQNLNQAFRNTMFGQSRTGTEFAMRMREAAQAKRAQEAMPEVYQNAANVPGALGKGGGFSSSFEDRAGTSLGSGQFSSKTSTGRQGY